MVVCDRLLLGCRPLLLPLPLPLLPPLPLLLGLGLLGLAAGELGLLVVLRLRLLPAPPGMMLRAVHQLKQGWQQQAHATQQHEAR